MNEERQRNINNAYKYLKYKYPDPPAITKKGIRGEIETKFSLSKDESIVVYDTWKERDLGMSAPKRKKKKGKINETKIPKGEIVYRFEWAKNQEKLKEIHERYKKHEDIKELAKEVFTSEANLLNSFRIYKAKGILYGNRIPKKDYVIISRKKFTFDEMRKIIERIDKGVGFEKVAKELKVEGRNLRNSYKRYKNKI